MNRKHWMAMVGGATNLLACIPVDDRVLGPASTDAGDAGWYADASDGASTVEAAVGGDGPTLVSAYGDAAVADRSVVPPPRSQDASVSDAPVAFDASDASDASDAAQAVDGTQATVDALQLADVASEADPSPDGSPACAPASLPAPTLVSPTLGAYTGSLHADSSANAVNPPLRPKFTWMAVAGTGVTYDIELDSSCTPKTYRSCTFGAAAIAQTGLAETSYQPTEPLPADALPNQGAGRRYYWRVRACDQSHCCSPWSTPRYLEVGRVRDDVNGDGYSDAVTAIKASGDRLYVYLGGAQGDPIHPIDGACDGLIFYVKKPLGQDDDGDLPVNRWVSLVDVNADGYSDILVFTSFGDVALYLGGSGFSTTFACSAQFGRDPELTLTGDAHSDFGYAISSAGDLDADGFADFVITAPALEGNVQPTAQIFFGGTSLPNIGASRITLSNSDAAGTTQFGIDATGVDDWDGDGHPDVVVLSNQSAYWLKGADHRDGVRANAKAPTVFDGHQAKRLCRAGDIHGDGYSDVGFAAVGHELWLGKGGPSVPNSLLAYTDEPNSYRWYYDCGGGYDLDGDRLPDLWLQTKHGRPVELNTMVSSDLAPGDGGVTPLGVVAGFAFGGYLDFNGDGAADIYVADRFVQHQIWLSPTPSSQSRVMLTLPTSTQPWGVLAR